MTNITDTYRLAVAADLPAIVSIYNQAIPSRQATADLSLVSVSERQAWFDSHLSNPNRPIWVVERHDIDTQITKSQTDTQDMHIIAWGCFADSFSRPAYHITAEISIYVAQQVRGQGVGKALLAHLLAQAASYGIHQVMAKIFAHNTPSLALFAQFGFARWGLLPQVCDMDDFIADVVIMGKSVLPTHVKESIP